MGALKLSAVSNKPISSRDSESEEIKQPREIVMTIDKLAVTLPITDAANQNTVRKALYKADKVSTHFKQGIRKSGRYRIAVVLHVPGRGPVLICADPVEPKTSFLRMEWNPARLDRDGNEFLCEQLPTVIPGLVESFSRNAKVTRVDIALDLYDIHINDLIVRAIRKQRQTIICGRDRNIETLYFGGSRGNAQVVAYNKRKQIKSHSKRELGCELTRIEVRRKNPNLLLIELEELPNPLGLLEVFHRQPGAVKWSGWVSFLDSCVLRGPKAALKLLPESRRKSVSQMLAASQPAWWKPDEFWGKWPRLAWECVI